jgi:hypothetical protein
MLLILLIYIFRKIYCIGQTLHASSGESKAFWVVTLNVL